MRISPTLLLPPWALRCVIFAVSVSFVSLLGIWISLGLGSLWARLAWAAGGVFYCTMMLGEAIRCVVDARNKSLIEGFLGGPPSILCVLSWNAVKCPPIILCEFSLLVVGVAAISFNVQRCRAQLVLLDEVSPRQCNEPFQFSLRSLMGGVAALAILLAICQSSRVYDSEDGLQVFFTTAVGVLMALIALAAVWAALGPRRPLIPVAVVVLGSICLGVAVGSFERTPPPFFHSALFASVQVVGIVGPLLVVRSYGYRLVRRAGSSGEGVVGI